MSSPDIASFLSILFIFVHMLSCIVMNTLPVTILFFTRIVFEPANNFGNIFMIFPSKRHDFSIIFSKNWHYFMNDLLKFVLGSLNFRWSSQNQSRFAWTSLSWILRWPYEYPPKWRWKGPKTDPTRELLLNNFGWNISVYTVGLLKGWR